MKRCFEWSVPQKRCYHRIKTGFRWHKGEILRFLTLGSSPNMKRDPEKSFYILYKRIQRLTPLKLCQDGYVSNAQLRNQYADVPLNEPLSFDYIKIKTVEGPHGVLHILYFGDFLPQRWLKDNWLEITGECRSAYIKACNKGIYDGNSLARYCIAQYCISQQDDGSSKFLRYSWSHSWAYPGFARDWDIHKMLLRDECKPVLYQAWNEYIDWKKRAPSPLTEVPLEVFCS